MELEKLQWQMNCCCDGSKIQDNQVERIFIVCWKLLVLEVHEG